MPRILVTDGEQRASLAVVRSLARAGHQVFVCSSVPRSLAGASRFAAGHAQVPDPLRHASDFVAHIRRLVSAHAIDVLLPVSEPALLALLPQRAAFADVVFPFVELEVFQRVCDKAAVLEQARTLGIAAPAQYVLDGPATLMEPRFPVVVKPTRSVVGENGTRAKYGALHAADAAALEPILVDLPASAYPLLVQERITGPGIGVFVLLWNGVVQASFGHRRIREKPPWGGVSVCCASCEVSAPLLDASVQLLRSLGWNGVAMVEYKIDAATGQPNLMEINGRFWGSLQLAIDAGVDFPALLVDAALGDTRAPVTAYRAGVRSRWWWGEVDHLIARLKHSNDQLGLPAGAPSRMRALADFVAGSADGSHADVFRWSDPMPALVESFDWLRERVHSSSRALRRRTS